ncbi:hypothetical protein [Allofranklinella schreckenbergeri]|uniref:hypothetical protein n=1 Tax=Allofranklinella schreckenbergeri TaxID=1076744 RepID=UPI001EEED046|nr:hypothetical protein [Allofranklinella schreckenbergeri]
MAPRPFPENGKRGIVPQPQDGWICLYFKSIGNKNALFWHDGVLCVFPLKM